MPMLPERRHALRYIQLLSFLRRNQNLLQGDSTLILHAMLSQSRSVDLNETWSKDCNVCNITRRSKAPGAVCDSRKSQPIAECRRVVRKVCGESDHIANHVDILDWCVDWYVLLIDVGDGEVRFPRISVLNRDAKF